MSEIEEIGALKALRHCKAAGHANARSMAGSAKQSRPAKPGLLRRCRLNDASLDLCTIEYRQSRYMVLDRSRSAPLYRASGICDKRDAWAC
jgi:hypothetical protein